MLGRYLLSNFLEDGLREIGLGLSERNVGDLTGRKGIRVSVLVPTGCIVDGQVATLGK